MKKTDPPVKKTRQWVSKTFLKNRNREKMPYEEDKLQGIPDEESQDLESLKK